MRLSQLRWPQGEALDRTRKYVEEATGQYPGRFNDCNAIAVIDDGYEIVGGIVENYVHTAYGKIVNMELTVAMMEHGQMTRRRLKYLFGHWFYRMGVMRLTARVRASNERVRRIDEKLGFVLEGVEKGTWDGYDDTALYRMLPSECRFLPTIEEFHRLELQYGMEIEKEMNDVQFTQQAQ